MKKRVCFPMVVLLMVVTLAGPTTAVHAGRAAQSYQASHIVQAGETLSQIAARYGVTASAIQAANGLADPNRIYVGMVLQIPASSYGASGGSSTGPIVSSPSGASTQSRSTPGGCANPYTVQPGDTLSGVAARCGVSLSSLANANGLNTSSMLYVGQRLVLSGATRSTTVSVEPPSSSLPSTGSGCSNPYTVTRNDTLSSIARLCNVSIANLKQWNNLITDWIWVGQSLKTRPSTSPYQPPTVFATPTIDVAPGTQAPAGAVTPEPAATPVPPSPIVVIPPPPPATPSIEPTVRP